MAPLPARRLFAAQGLSGPVRASLKRDFSEIPTVNISFLAQQDGMPADWRADAQAELKRRENLPYGCEPIRFASGYRFFGSGS